MSNFVKKIKKKVEWTVEATNNVVGTKNVVQQSSSMFWTRRENVMLNMWNPPNYPLQLVLIWKF